MKLGIFGGTFDPPHVGHIVAASQAGWLAGLDRVLMVVAHSPWQKEGTRSITEPDRRFQMLRAAVAGASVLVASRIELDRGGPSYTIDTVEHLRISEPGADLFVIVGADAAAGIDSWHRAEELRELVALIVVDRPGHSCDAVPPGWSWQSAEMPRLDVSGTDLRRRVGAGEPIHGLVPPLVAAMIADEQLYG